MYNDRKELHSAMRRRYHRRKWIFLCFLGSMVILPIAAALQKSGHTVTPSAAFQSAEQEESHAAEQASLTWNVASDGYGWEEESAVPAESEIPVQRASADPGEKPYPAAWTLNPDTAIQRTFYGTYSGTRFFNLSTAGQVQNKTSLTNTALQAESELAPAFTIDKITEPQVLIMHTHTTESFEPYVRSQFDTNFNYRTTDPAYNMVSVGDAITTQLEQAGIGVIHDTTIHDYPSYNGSYDRSAVTVQKNLEQYPSIRVVLDIHRDAIQKENTLVQPVVEIGGKESAQVMIISGCDDGTMGMPHYMQNFHFACRLQSSMEQMFPGLTRPILFDYRKYNQNLTTGSLLLEIGTHGNTLEQAQYAGELVGKALAQTLLKLQK
jgi:stage II sporulation protein P